MSCNCKNSPTDEGKFVCQCDNFEHPLPLNIGAGLQDLPRQIAGFPEFRRAMLRAVRQYPALHFWNARNEGDFGVMLLEMWAYVCDSLAFYDKVIAQEAYLRTANLRPSLRRLVALLGYLPRPAVGASVSLAALADGRLPLTLPKGTAFRSGSFDGNPAQVFELDQDTIIHPLTNRWKIRAPRPGIISTLNPSFLLVSVQANIQPGALLLLSDQVKDEYTQTLHVKQVQPFIGADGQRYTKLEFSAPLKLPLGLDFARLRLMIPNQSAALYTVSDLSNSLTKKIVLDNIYKQIYAGDYILVEKNREEGRWYKVNGVKDTLQTEGDTNFLTTELTLDVEVDNEKRKKKTAEEWNVSGISSKLLPKLPSKLSSIRPSLISSLRVHYGMSPAGTIANEAKSTLTPEDTMEFEARAEVSVSGHNPTRFFVQDKNMRGLAVLGSIDFPKNQLKLGMNEGWDSELTLPVEVFGNALTTSRGETIRNEILGSGNASIPNQTFKLRKKPLTYIFSPTATNDNGVQNTLQVFINGIRWTETPSFFGKKPEDEVYIVRQNDQGDALITFGDGVRGSRIPSGTDNVVASYRFGAGKISPPANSITQIGTPVPGLGSIKNPVAASGGADAEGPEDIRKYGPKSALILGRAVSIQDMEAVTFSIPGVRNVQTEWHWNGNQQRAGVQIWYIGASDIANKIIGRLHYVTDPTTPIQVEPAKSVPITLTLNIETDPRYVEKNVLDQIRQKLAGFEQGILTPEILGIGKPVFRSRIFEAVLSVEGTKTVKGIFWNSQPFQAFAQTPGTGRYFDIEQGGLMLNGAF